MSETPPAVVVRRPAPGLARDPGVAPGHVAPGAIGVRGPAGIDPRIPDVTVVGILAPIAIVGEVVRVPPDLMRETLDDDVLGPRGSRLPSVAPAIEVVHAR